MVDVAIKTLRADAVGRSDVSANAIKGNCITLQHCCFVFSRSIFSRFISFSQEFLREAQLMARLKHPNVVNLLGVCMSQPVMIVQELVPLGALVGE